MYKLRYALKNLNVINIILAFIAVMVVFYAVLPLRLKSGTYTPAAVKSPSSPATDTGPKHDEVKPPSPNDYAVIAEQNVFHPDRKIPVPLPPPPPPLPKPDFVLYGTVITDGAYIAYMEDKKAPKTTQGRGKRQTPVRLGDSLSGFIMKEVNADKVVLVRGDESVVVHLNDKTKAREGAPGTAPTPAGQHAAPATSPFAGVPPKTAVEKQPAVAPPPAASSFGNQEQPKAPRARPSARGRRSIFGNFGAGE